jgi:carboxyl-terminal processing protease
VGIQIGYKNRQLAVISPLKGMPADKAGIKAGDYILDIRDKVRGVDVETSELTIPEAVSYIRGEKGTQVSLNLFREGQKEPFEMELVREEIIIPSVELVFKEVPGQEGNGQEIAYLSLTQFGDRTMDEWDIAVGEIEARAATIAGVVLDVRNNPGGFLNGAVEFASEFISEGTVVVQQGRNESETYQVAPGGRLVGVKVVVLVNEGSASASEILAGALRDRLGAKLVGTQTFGKGTVQEAKDMPGGAGLHVTTAEWVLPSGTKINGVGIKPDVEVEQVEDEEGVDEQLVQALNLVAG